MRAAVADLVAMAVLAGRTLPLPISKVRAVVAAVAVVMVVMAVTVV
jgi:hypothetical protein